MEDNNNFPYYVPHHDENHCPLCEWIARYRHHLDEVSNFRNYTREQKTEAVKESAKLLQDAYAMIETTDARHRNAESSPLN